jgi:spore cortex biosynthesis protein YabQ
MNFNIGLETANFFLSILLGLIFGMIYDLFRIARLAVKHKTIAVFIEDILFFTVIAFLSFIFSLASTNGTVRGYQIIGEISGFSLYIATLGEATLYFADKIIKIIKIIISVIIKFLIRPIYKITAKILNFIFYPLRFLINICKKGLKKGKYTLKKKTLLLYNLKSNKTKGSR